jgi:hypothetical protein
MVIDVKDLKKALVASKLEVFRVRADEVHLAERQNVQLMEAGVRVRGGEAPGIVVVVRAQRNDAPALSAEAFYDLVRSRSTALSDAEFTEVAARAREIRSVSDASLTDVWYEVEWTRATLDLEETVAEAKRAMSVERYVVP